MSVRAQGKTARGGRIEFAAFDVMELPWEAVVLLSQKLFRSLDGSIFCYAANLMVCQKLPMSFICIHLTNSIILKLLLER